QLGLLGLLAYLARLQGVRRLKTERELQGVRARAESVLQTVREPIVAVDAAQRVVMHNAAFAELYGDHEIDDGESPAAELASTEHFHGRPLAQIGDGAWQDPVFLQRL